MSDLPEIRIIHDRRKPDSMSAKDWAMAVQCIRNVQEDFNRAVRSGELQRIHDQYIQGTMGEYAPTNWFESMSLEKK